jgi:hypothetical protein
MDQCKQQVYEITGISDIVRGQGEQHETATAQRIKGQYASLRLRSMQDEVAQFATDALRLKAQIMCGKFQPETITQMAAVEQLSNADQRVIMPFPEPPPPEYQEAVQQAQQQGQQPPPPPPPEMNPGALALLIGEERLQDTEADSPNPLRSFRIDIAADTLVEIDEQQEKQDRMELLTVFGTFLEKAAMMPPTVLPLIIEVGKFGLTAFKVGKTIEGQFDEMLDQIKEQSQQPQEPPPDPEMMKLQAQQQLDQGRLEFDQQKFQMEGQAKQQEGQIAAQQKQAEMQANAQSTQEQLQAEMQKEQQRIESAERIAAAKLASEEKIAQAKIESEHEIKMEQIRTNAAFDMMNQNAEHEHKENELRSNEQGRELDRQDNENARASESFEKKETASKEDKSSQAMTKAIGEFAKVSKQLADNQTLIAKGL